MKYFLSFTLIANTLCTFSFWKMKQSGAYITPLGDHTTFEKCGEVDQFDFSKFIQRIEDKSYLMYWYDEYSGYGLYRVDQNVLFATMPNEQIKCSLYNFFANKTIVEKNIWPQLIRNESLMKLWQPKCFSLTPSPADNKIDDIIINNKDRSIDPLSHFQIKDFEYTKYYRSNSGVTIKNTPYGIELKKVVDSDEIKTIDFETVFKKYVKSHTSYGDQIKPYIIDLKDQKIEGAGKSMANLSRDSKMFFREDEITLLDQSEILAIWHLIPTTYTNKDYLEKDKKTNPSRWIEKPSKKIVHRMLIGLARDKNTGEVFHWVTDLGQDIEVLFDEFNIK